jgi:tetratricopeptide (TPR) repeat protein
MNFMAEAAFLLALPLLAADSAPTISVDLLRQPLPPKAKEILIKAHQASARGDHRSAIALLDSAHDKFPQADAWTESLSGVEYLRTGQFEAAVAALECAVRLLPRDSVDRANLGFALAAQGRYAEAAEQLRQAVELDHNNQKARQLLTVVLAR